jgi:hypothetical protein
MEPWDYHKMYPSNDFESIFGYPNEYKFDVRWLEYYPKFEGFFIIHIVELFKYPWEVKSHQGDIQIKLFRYFMPLELQYWVKDYCKTKGIYSLIGLISIFIEYC